MIRLKRWLALALAAALVGTLAGCAQEREEELTFLACAGSDVTTLDPAYISTVSDATIVSSLYENLMKLTSDVNGNTVVTEGMARSVEEVENFDGTVTYTFRLRSAHWSDGRDVTAGDFVYAWQRLVTPVFQSPNAEMLSIVQGYDEVKATSDPSALAVTAKNASTLVVTLSGKYDWFLTDVCTSPVTSPLRQDVLQSLKDEAQAAAEDAGMDPADPLAPKWWYDPTALVTNGPYYASEYAAGSHLELEASEQYYMRLPNDGVHMEFADNAEDAWALYEAEAVDFVYALPESQMELRQEADENWIASPELSTYTVLFNGDYQPFDDPSVRQAMSLAVDRVALADLAGITARAATGLVPYGVPGHADDEEDFRTSGGDLLATDPELYAENCERARSLLAQSGYDEHYELEYLYLDEGPAAQIAQALVQQWQTVLNVKVTPTAVATQSELTARLFYGDFSLAGSVQPVNINDAEAFLSPFTGQSSRNAIRYANSAYDTLLSIIDSASDDAARVACLHDAEVLLLDDAAVAPLYFTGTAWQLRAGFAGLCRDPRGWFTFSSVGTVTV